MQKIDVDFKDIDKKSFYDGLYHSRLILLKSGLPASHEMAKILTNEILRLYGNRIADYHE